MALPRQIKYRYENWYAHACRCLIFCFSWLRRVFDPDSSNTKTVSVFVLFFLVEDSMRRVFDPDSSITKTVPVFVLLFFLVEEGFRP